MSNKDMPSKPYTSNPRWIGEECVWDINLTNGETHSAVSKKDISVILGKLYRANMCGLYESYIDIVRQCHINLYDKWYTSALAELEGRG